MARDCGSPLAGRNILVTGGAGSFGQAFVRRCLDDGAARVAIYSRDEAKHAAMRATFNDLRLRFFIGDVRDVDRLTDACRGVDLVIHASALKRVEVCEEQPREAIATNVDGTVNVARACIATGVRQAVLLSTDKAAAPNTLYGATKLVAERAWLGENVYSAGTPTRFSATRYGNVANSRGSVIPLFRQQAEHGVLTITDRRMTRFFMSMAAAVDLVVLAVRVDRPGSVFVPKIQGATIVDLAQAVAPECALEEIGVRPGEKLHETLVTEDESRWTYDAGEYLIIEPASRSYGTVPPLPYPLVASGFSYRSDTADTLSNAALSALVAA